MKKHITIKRLSALALFLVMALVPAAPAGAAAGDEVRIYPNSYTSVPTGANDNLRTGRFKAYQIFKGTIDKTKYQKEESDPFTGEILPNLQPIANELGDAQWGSGISENKIKELLAALILEPTYVRDMSFPNQEQLISRLFEAGGLYLQTPGFQDCYEEYNKESNWEIPEGGETGKVGGTLTAAGEANLLRVLRQAVARETELTFGDLLVSALKHEGYEIDADTGVVTAPDGTGLTLGYSAEMVMRVLKDFTNPEKPYSREFAEDFAQKVSARKSDGTFDYLSSNPTPSEWDADGHWVFKDLQPGYYFIIDTYTTNATSNAYNDTDNDTAQSDFIVAVFGSQDVIIKTHAPTVQKVITNYGGGDAYGGDFEIGETIKFRITGTLPENYNNYSAYSYTFTDTLPAGLSYQEDSMEVYAVDPGGGTYPLKKGSDFTITYTSASDSTSAVIKFEDLKRLDGGAVTSGWRFVVEYQATLNESAEFKNVTTAYLTYSSSSINAGSTVNTTKAVNYIYTFGVTIMKYYEDFVGDPIGGDPEKPLPGAGFSVIKDNQYALFDENGCLSGWISKEDLGGDNIVWADIADPNGKLTDLDYDGKHIYFLTNSQGKLDVGSLKGLKADADYSLYEVIVPDGYDDPDGNTTIRFSAAYEDNGALSSLTCAVDGSPVSIVEEDGEYGDDLPLIADLKLINYPTEALIDTGGMGTTLFYTGGGALLASAALIWIISRVKRRNEKHVRYVNTQK